MIKSYKDLIVWQKSIQMARLCYTLSKTFPKDELYGLTSQLRRAAVSVSANIAEGRSRGSRKDFVQFLRIANGSLAEVETLLTLACEFGYCSNNDIDAIHSETSEIGKMLNTMIRQLLITKAESSKLTAESLEAA
jgi:four helix bundle protein